MLTLTQISELVKQGALRAGFDLAGVAGIHNSAELDYFPEWIASGYAGEMKYLESRDEAGRLKRSSLRSAHSSSNLVEKFGLLHYASKFVKESFVSRTCCLCAMPTTRAVRTATGLALT